MKCSVEECENEATRKGACLCEKHYMRLRRYGDVSTTYLYQPDKRTSRNRGCQIEGCKNPIHARELCAMHYQRKGDKGSNLRRKAEHGEGSINAYGYRVLCLDGRRVMQHRLVAEKALGKPLPPGAIVHHLNGNRLDNRPCNLVICPDEAYHKLLHRRQKAISYKGPE